MKIRKLKKNIYVYADLNYFCGSHRCEVWNGLLERFPGVEVLREDSEGNIEFKATPKSLKILTQLLDNDYDAIFHGTLEEFYAENE